MHGWRVSWNSGMLLAAALLVAGGALMLFAPADGVLHTLGFGVVVLSGVVYLVARIAQIVKDRRS